MKNRSVFEWILVAILSILLLSVVTGFVYLLYQYRSSALVVPVISQTSAVSTKGTLSLPNGIETTGVSLPIPSPSITSHPIQKTFTTFPPTPTLFQLKNPITPVVAPYSHFIFTRPLDPTLPIWPLKELRYGSASNRSSENGIHTGLDLLANYGTPVYALGAGEVIWSGYGIESYAGPDNPYGVAITIKHDTVINKQSVYSIYAHLSVTHAEIGDRVAGGDLIGEVGLTGNTSGPHLHLEVRLGDDSSFITRNPELYIQPLPGHGVLVARLLKSDGSILYNQEVAIESLADHQIWVASSYATGAATSDYLLKENLVVTDLPAGQYAIIINFGGAELHHSVIIKPGEISYFTFQGYAGYYDGIPTADIQPVQETP